MTYRLNLLHLLLCGFVVLASTPAIAQITPDNTLGAALTTVTTGIKRYVISSTTKEDIFTPF